MHEYCNKAGKKWLNFKNKFYVPGAFLYAPFSFSLFSNKICPAVQKSADFTVHVHNIS